MNKNGSTVGNSFNQANSSIISSLNKNSTTKIIDSSAFKNVKKIDEIRYYNDNYTIQSFLKIKDNSYPGYSLPGSRPNN